MMSPAEHRRCLAEARAQRDLEIVQTGAFILNQLHRLRLDLTGCPTYEVIPVAEARCHHILREAMERSRLMILQSMTWDISFNEQTRALHIQLKPLTDEATRWIKEQQERGTWPPP